MLHNKRSLKVSIPQSTRNNPPPSASGTSSEIGCTSLPISKESPIPSLSSRYLSIASVPEPLQPQGEPSRRGMWSSTFSRLARYFQPWGTTTPGKTSWARSSFAWDNSLRTTQSKTLLLPESVPFQYPSSYPSPSHSGIRHPIP